MLVKTKLLLRKLSEGISNLHASWDLNVSCGTVSVTEYQLKRCYDM